MIEVLSTEPNTLVSQIWLQGESGLPPEYKKYSDKYKELNSGNYILWDDKRIQALLRVHYPHLLNIYRNYDFWVMRVDLAKYVILHRYGGFYIDMDTEPKASFKPMAMAANNKPMFYLKKFSWQLQLALGSYLNNNFMYSPYPKHPLFALFIKRVQQSSPRMFYDLKIYYILNSVGPHFMMRVVKEYLNSGKEITVLTEKATDEFFHDEGAVTWLKKQWFDTRDKWLLTAGLTMLILLYLSIKHMKNKD